MYVMKRRILPMATIIAHRRHILTKNGAGGKLRRGTKHMTDAVSRAICRANMGLSVQQPCHSGKHVKAQILRQTRARSKAIESQIAKQHQRAVHVYNETKQ
jgi:hypothetical protein